MKKILALLITASLILSAFAIPTAVSAANVILGDFPMESVNSNVTMQGGNPETNYLEHADSEHTGKYLLASGSNGLTKCILNEKVDAGCFSVEYEINATSGSSIFIGNSTVQDGATALFSNIGTVGEWNKFKVTIELTPGSSYDTVYAVLYDEDGKKMNETHKTTQASVWDESIKNYTTFDFRGIDYIAFFSGWGSNKHALDNVFVKRINPTVEKVYFENIDGTLVDSYGDLSDGLAGIALTFSTEMNIDSVAATLINGYGETDITVDKSGNTIIVRPMSGSFDINENYILTIMKGAFDIYGLELEENYVFEFNTEKAYKSIVFAEYPMDGPNPNVTRHGKNSVESDYRTDPERGKYVHGTGTNGFTRCFFDREIKYGSFDIEFEFMPSSTGSVSVSNMGENGRTLMLFSGIGEADVWHKYKIKLDLIPGEINDAVNAVLYDEYGNILEEKSLTTTSKEWNSSLAKDEYFDFHGIDSIGFFSSWAAGSYQCIDNVRITYSEASYDRIVFRDFEGNEAAKTAELPGLLESVELLFTNDLDADNEAPMLYNMTRGAVEPCRAEFDGRKVRVYPQRGYFEADSEYKVVYEDDIKDAYGNTALTLPDEFFVTQKGGMGVAGLQILKNGSKVEMSDISAGDTVELELDYVLIDEAGGEAILAIAARKGGKITGFAKEKAAISEMGRHTTKIMYTFPENLQFDSVCGYAWDAFSRVPLMNEFVLK